MRASGNVDASSPTTAAVDDMNKKISDRQRMAAVVSQRSQADMDEASANYLRQTGQYAMVMGNKAASADKMAGYAQLLGSIAKGVSGFGGGGPSIFSGNDNFGFSLDPGRWRRARGAAGSVAVCSVEGAA